MTYEQVASITQVAALLFFVALFVGVVIYAFWPGNKKRFEKDARDPAGERSRSGNGRLSAMARHDTDEATGAETTGHEWDGITRAEQAVAQMVAVDVLRHDRLGDRLLARLMPAWPLVTTYTKGCSAIASASAWPSSSRRPRPPRRNFAIRSPPMDLAAIVADPELLRFALAGGEAAFGDNCAPCHGRGAQGAFGYPNLRDDSWLWGDGSLAAIHQTILHGIRADDPDTRTQSDAGLRPHRNAGRAANPDVAEYVLSLSGSADDQAAADRGAKIFAANCTPCHGADGKGNPTLGAPESHRRAVALCRRQG